jgi:hypothetical protein
MVKKIHLSLSLVLATVILFSVTISSYFFVSYQFNRAAIAEQFCVNKTKPKLNCNGKCHLSKQLKKAEQHDPSDENGFPPLKELNQPNWLTASTIEINVYPVLTHHQYPQIEPQPLNGFLRIVLPPPEYRIA